MLLFPTRELARSFAKNGGRKVVDCGATQKLRWGVKVVKR